MLSVRWHALTPAIAVIAFSALLQTLRWKLLLPDERISVARLYMVLSAGQSLNQLLPLRVAGEATQFAMLTRANNIHGGKVVASIFMNRALDLMVTTTMMAIGFFAIPQLSAFKPAIIPSIAIGTGIILLFAFSGWLSSIGFLQGFGPVRNALSLLTLWRRRSSRLVIAAVITAIAWLSLGTGAWLIAQTLSIALPFWKIAILLVMMTSFASIIPTSPASIGVFEFACMYILGLFTVDKSSALSFALVVHLLLFMPSLVIGVPVLFRDHKALRDTTRSVGRLFFVRG